MNETHTRLKQKLMTFDFFYDKSDDLRDWQKGAVQYTEIRTLLRQCASISQPDLNLVIDDVVEARGATPQMLKAMNFLVKWRSKGDA